MLVMFLLVQEITSRTTTQSQLNATDLVVQVVVHQALKQDLLVGSASPGLLTEWVAVVPVGMSEETSHSTEV